MEVKIGVVYTGKELLVEVEGKVDDVVGGIEKTLQDGGGPVLWLTDRRGKRVGVPVDKVAYIEVGEEESKKVGFGPG